MTLVTVFAGLGVTACAIWLPEAFQRLCTSLLQLTVLGLIFLCVLTLFGILPL